MQHKQIKFPWTVVASASGAALGRESFPELETEEAQVDALWNEIFKTCRVYEADPVQAWDEHEVRLRSKADVLNAEHLILYIIRRQKALT